MFRTGDPGDQSALDITADQSALDITAAVNRYVEKHAGAVLPAVDRNLYVRVRGYEHR